MKEVSPWLIVLVVRLAVGLLLAALLLVELLGVTPPEKVAACREALAQLHKLFGS